MAKKCWYSPISCKTSESPFQVLSWSLAIWPLAFNCQTLLMRTVWNKCTNTVGVQSCLGANETNRPKEKLTLLFQRECRKLQSLSMTPFPLRAARTAQVRMAGSLRPAAPPVAVSRLPGTHQFWRLPVKTLQLAGEVRRGAGHEVAPERPAGGVPALPPGPRRGGAAAYHLLNVFLGVGPRRWTLRGAGIALSGSVAVLWGRWGSLPVCAPAAETSRKRNGAACTVRPIREGLLTPADISWRRVSIKRSGCSEDLLARPRTEDSSSSWAPRPPRGKSPDRRQRVPGAVRALARPRLTVPAETPPGRAGEGGAGSRHGHRNAGSAQAH